MVQVLKCLKKLKPYISKVMLCLNVIMELVLHSSKVFDVNTFTIEF